MRAECRVYVLMAVMHCANAVLWCHGACHMYMCRGIGGRTCSAEVCEYLDVHMQGWRSAERKSRKQKQKWQVDDGGAAGGSDVQVERRTELLVVQNAVSDDANTATIDTRTDIAGLSCSQTREVSGARELRSVLQQEYQTQHQNVHEDSSRHAVERLCHEEQPSDAVYPQQHRHQHQYRQQTVMENVQSQQSQQPHQPREQQQHNSDLNQQLAPQLHNQQIQIHQSHSPHELQMELSAQQNSQVSQQSLWDPQQFASDGAVMLPSLSALAGACESEMESEKDKSKTTYSNSASGGGHTYLDHACL